MDTLILPETGKRLYFYDTKVRGLELMITEQGSRSFQVYRKGNGKPVRVTLGKYSEMSIENARNEAQRVIAEMINGKNRNEEKKKIRVEITFGETFEMFMEKYSKIYKKSWQYDQREVNRFLKHWFKTKISDISKQEIQLLHEKIRKGSGLYQANPLFERVKVIYNKAIEWGWEGANPTQRIKKFKEKSRDRFLHPDELPRFFESLDMEENEAIREYVYISLFTGVRKSNVLAMRWENVHLDRREWLIPETKNGDSLRVHLIETVIDILKCRAEKYGRKNGYLKEAGQQTILLSLNRDGKEYWSARS